MEAIDEIRDSLIVNLDLPNDEFFMPLFVQLAEGVELDQALEQKIRAELRRRYSPRHVPDGIYEVDEVPYTITGKKMEVPVRRILMGTPIEKAANTSVMRNPGSLEWFVRFAESRAL
jgi:acetoacetyl-CoA synthetase